jgi:regulator of cell morphogenesis and NO signaling
MKSNNKNQQESQTVFQSMQACETGCIPRSALQLSILRPSGSDNGYAKWDLCVLADYIVNVHHRYIRESGPVLLQSARKVAHHHGKHHHELLQLETFLRHSLENMMTHMDQEEIVLFPAIRQLVDPDRSVDQAGKESLQSIRQAVAKMRLEHLAAEDDLRLYRRLTHDYALPSGACNSYKFLFDKLKEFEANIHLHVHLENDILFPRALALHDNSHTR